MREVIARIHVRCRWMAFSPPTTAVPFGIPEWILFGILLAGGENAIQRLLYIKRHFPIYF